TARSAGRSPSRSASSPTCSVRFSRCATTRTARWQRSRCSSALTSVRSRPIFSGRADGSGNHWRLSMGRISRSDHPSDADLLEEFLARETHPHLAHCVRCAERAETIAREIDPAREEPEELLDDLFYRRQAARIRARIAEGERRRSSPRPAVPRSAVPKLAWAGAAAAAVVALVVAATGTPAFGGSGFPDGGMHHGKFWKKSKVRHELQLTDDEVRTLEHIFARNQQTLTDLEADVERKKDDLDTLFTLLIADE